MMIWYIKKIQIIWDYNIINHDDGGDDDDGLYLVYYCNMVYNFVIPSIQLHI